MGERLILDTCAMIWISQDEKIDETAAELVDAAALDNSLSISAMSAWEMGMLVAKGRLPSRIPPLRWFNEFLDVSGVKIEDALPDILVASSFLPAPIHNDPMDRILIATARERDLTIVTRDRAILTYGALGHVKTLPC
ncbi:MAG: type II toxin-antitoxin system VapC family toxin [Hoeflea sp.]|nr:type II toxin-antitoxin system VapC family toxin [Alphaproteobacteria bacterium]MBV1726160.1 type II toxin-antitoxin system VapC family toxin [Hoeflea sp.]MBU4545638.1 type II toxin-antitoxin system VapC family toxin [Alphaproteobacteria bacterium]MBU4552248.1 type II toxin-antitoxin system VapC family toxin [Alphaproteobacteria bacterium]MBV1762413.1 type II toxin-antitoxin system VapC family toxin [Hoeflea sp.]